MPTFLVIGYGNQLRGDDGIGPRVAAQVEAWKLPNVQVLSVHQLMPELSETLAQFDAAIFIDACVAQDSENLTETLQILPVEPQELIGSQLGHYMNPGYLLALAKILYHHTPKAWLISVAGINFELSENLSPVAQDGVIAAVAKIQHILLTNEWAIS